MSSPDESRPETDLSDTSHWNDVYSTVPSQRPQAGGARIAFRRFRRRKLNSVLRRFTDTLPSESAAILELGTAPGLMLEFLSCVAPRARLHGIDYSPEGVSVARRRLESAGVEATILEGDFRTLDVEQKFSLVVSFGLIEHFEDPMPVLRQHMRFCAPDGWVGVTVPNLAHPIVEKLARHYAPKTMATHNLAIMDDAAMRDAMRRAGLADVRSGSAGGPHLSMAVEPGHPTGPVYRRLAGLWNLTAELAPFDAFWHRTIWGLGRLPESP